MSTDGLADDDSAVQAADVIEHEGSEPSASGEVAPPPMSWRSPGATPEHPGMGGSLDSLDDGGTGDAGSGALTEAPPFPGSVMDSEQQGPDAEMVPQDLGLLSRDLLEEVGAEGDDWNEVHVANTPPVGGFNTPSETRSLSPRLEATPLQDGARAHTDSSEVIMSIDQWDWKTDAPEFIPGPDMGGFFPGANSNAKGASSTGVGSALLTPSDAQVGGTTGGMWKNMDTSHVWKDSGFDQWEQGTRGSGDGAFTGAWSIGNGDSPETNIQEAQQLRSQYEWQIRTKDHELQELQSRMNRLEIERAQIRTQWEHERQELLRQVQAYQACLERYGIPNKEGEMKDGPLHWAEQQWGFGSSGPSADDRSGQANQHEGKESSLDSKMRQLNNLLQETQSGPSSRRRGVERGDAEEGQGDSNAADGSKGGNYQSSGSIASTLQAMFPHAKIRTKSVPGDPTGEDQWKDDGQGSFRQDGSGAVRDALLQMRDGEGELDGGAKAIDDRAMDVMADTEAVRQIAELANSLEKATESKIDDRALRALGSLTDSDAFEALQRVEGLVQSQGGHCRNLSSILQSVCRKIEKRGSRGAKEFGEDGRERLDSDMADKNGTGTRLEPRRDRRALDKDQEMDPEKKRILAAEERNRVAAERRKNRRFDDDDDAFKSSSDGDQWGKGGRGKGSQQERSPQIAPSDTPMSKKSWADIESGEDDDDLGENGMDGSRKGRKKKRRDRKKRREKGLDDGDEDSEMMKRGNASELRARRARQQDEEGDAFDGSSGSDDQGQGQEGQGYLDTPMSKKSWADLDESDDEDEPLPASAVPRGVRGDSEEEYWSMARIERIGKQGFELKRRSGSSKYWDLKIYMGSLDPPLTSVGMERYCKWLRGRLKSFRESFGDDPLKKCRAEIDFSRNSLGNEAVWVLLETLAQLEVHAAIFKLYHNGISQGGILALCEFIRTNDSAEPVHELHLSHNEIDDESTIELLRTLYEQRPRYPPKRWVEGFSEPVHTPVWLRLNNNRIKDPAALLRTAEQMGITYCCARNWQVCGPNKCFRKECALAHLYNIEIQFSQKDKQKEWKDKDRKDWKDSGQWREDDDDEGRNRRKRGRKRGKRDGYDDYSDDDSSRRYDKAGDSGKKGYEVTRSQDGSRIQ